MTTPLRDDLQRALGAAYRLERELGGGGMSRVFVAEEVALGRRVVVKILPAELVAGLSVERFRREIQLAAQLQHPHIVPVLATGEADGLPWFTMPFVSGESLRARLARDGRLALRDAVQILRDVASALEFAHAQGVVHRDIKPDNVLLAGRAAVVTDFGIAKAISASRTAAPGGTLTQVGTSLGTPAYMAPEQATGDPNTDFRADLYAWGVMAFEVLSGRLPFAATAPHELIRAHMLEPAPDLASLRADLPPSLTTLGARCLAKRPDDRPADAAALVRELEAIPLSGERTQSSGPVAQPPRRRLGLVAAVALVGIGAVVATAVWRRPTVAPETTAATAAPPAFDPALLLLVPPTVSDPALASAASLATEALSRRLAGMRYAQVTVASGAPTADHRAEATAGRMATILDGRLNVAGDSLQLDLRLTTTETGRVLRALPPIRVSRRDPSRGLEAALEPTLSAVALVTHPLFGPATLPVDRLPALAAVKALEQALLERSFSESNRALDRVVQLDTSWALSRIIRAFRYVTYSPYYGDEATHRRLVSALPGTSAQLSPYDAALRDATLGITNSSPEGQLTALRRLQQIAPGSFGSTFYIGILQTLNRPREALEQLERIGPFRRDPESPAGAPLVESAGYWTNVADLGHYIGDHQRERDAAERAATLAGMNVSTLIRRGVAYAALGDSAAVEDVIEKADVVASEAAPNNFGGEVMLIVAQELMAHGHEAHGRQVLERSLRWLAQHRDDRMPGADTVRSDIRFREALALRVAGRDAEALETVRPLAALETSDMRFKAFYGRVQGAMGNDAAADSVNAWLLVQQQDPAKAGTALSERAFLAAARGRREDAVALLREAFARGLVFYIRRNLHRFNDWFSLKGYAPYDRMVTPEG